MATTQKNNSGNSSKANQGSHSRSASSNNSGNFANMDENKQKEMASKGGKASHTGSNSTGRH